MSQFNLAESHGTNAHTPTIASPRAHETQLYNPAGSHASSNLLVPDLVRRVDEVEFLILLELVRLQLVKPEGKLKIVIVLRGVSRRGTAMITSPARAFTTII